MIKARKCKLCKRKLGSTNKSGYCTKCYRKSPQYKKYQRDYQRDVYYDEKGKEYKQKYYQDPKVKNKRKKYMRHYMKVYNSFPDVKEKKNQWAKENYDEERKKYQRKWREKKKKKNRKI
jgi:hypothetical protein